MVGVEGAVFDWGHTIRELEPYEAALLCDWTGAKVAIPMHYTDKGDLEEFLEQAKYRAPHAKIVSMQPGQVIEYEKGKLIE